MSIDENPNNEDGVRDIFEKRRKEEEELLADMNNTAIETLSQKYEDMSLRLASLGIYGGGSRSPEYLQLEEDFENLEHEHGADIFSYLTKKAVLSEKKWGKPWRFVLEAHYFDNFIKPDILERYAAKLDDESVKFILRNLERRIAIVEAKITEMEQFDSMKGTAEEARKEAVHYAECLNALLPYIEDEGREFTGSIVRRYSS